MKAIKTVSVNFHWPWADADLNTEISERVDEMMWDTLLARIQAGIAKLYPEAIDSFDADESEYVTFTFKDVQVDYYIDRINMALEELFKEFIAQAQKDYEEEFKEELEAEKGNFWTTA